jgi:hypothetical protein
MIGPKRLEEITEKAGIAFWKSIAEQLPEYDAKHLDHGTAIVLQMQMKEAIERYIKANLIAIEEPEPEKIDPIDPNGRRRSQRNGNIR